jgi:hypothetical protein
VRVAIGITEHRTITMVHRRRVHAAERLALGGGAASGLVSAGAFLAEAASALVSALTLALAWALGASMALTLIRALAL